MGNPVCLYPHRVIPASAGIHSDLEIWCTDWVEKATQSHIHRENNEFPPARE